MLSRALGSEMFCDYTASLGIFISVDDANTAFTIMFSLDITDIHKDNTDRRSRGSA